MFNIPLLLDKPVLSLYLRKQNISKKKAKITAIWNHSLYFFVSLPLLQNGWMRKKDLHLITMMSAWTVILLRTLGPTGGLLSSVWHNEIMAWRGSLASREPTFQFLLLLWTAYMVEDRNIRGGAYLETVLALYYTCSLNGSCLHTDLVQIIAMDSRVIECELLARCHKKKRIQWEIRINTDSWNNSKEN